MQFIKVNRKIQIGKIIAPIARENTPFPYSILLTLKKICDIIPYVSKYGQTSKNANGEHSFGNS